LKLHKTQKEMMQKRQGILSSWAVPCPGSHYMKRMGGYTNSVVPSQPVLHELQLYTKAAKLAYGVIMSLKEEGKIRHEPLKRLL